MKGFILIKLVIFLLFEAVCYTLPEKRSSREEIGDRRCSKLTVLKVLTQYLP